jgi:hypothetical protein
MMNERIFELAKQADLIQWDTLPSGAKTPDYESVVKAKKFAELIVRECTRIIANQAWESRTAGANGDWTEYNTLSRVAGQIKEHFGVDYNPVEE